MAAVDTLRILVASSAIATSGLLAPSELMLDRVDGYELTSDPAVDLDYDEYFALEPASIAHIEPGSDAALGMLAAIEVWTNLAGDEVLVVEIVRSVDDSAAKSVVDQAAANSIAEGLGATDPPFGGAWSYSGGLDETWTNMASWNQGPYAVALTHLAVEETARDTIDAAAVRQVQIILDATGYEVDEGAAVADDAPVPPTEAPVEPSSDGGIPIGKVVLWLAVIGGAIYLFVKLRRKMQDGRPAPSRSADEIIAEARKQGRAERSTPTESTDDIIERARRDARAEVDRTAGEWKIPDDF